MSNQDTQVALQNERRTIANKSAQITPEQEHRVIHEGFIPDAPQSEPCVTIGKDSLDTLETSQCEHRDQSEENVKAASELPFITADEWTYPAGVVEQIMQESENWDKKSHILISMDPSELKEFENAYRLTPISPLDITTQFPTPKQPSPLRISVNTKMDSYSSSTQIGIPGYVSLGIKLILF